MSGHDRGGRLRAILAEAVHAHERALARDVAPLAALADAMVATLRGGGKILVFGNGGSAADAQHFAAELVGRFLKERRSLAAIALTTDTSVMTAVGNDYGFERVFARQVEALARRGDLALAITTSGTSPNLVAALAAARALDGVATAALTGRDGGGVAGLVDLHVNVPETSAARIQEVHRTLLHALCEVVEAEAGA
jgi:D-sedoheptulose 7-phosphate isomerase